MNVPRFRLWECFEFMLWWPFQGVTVASVPVMVLCLFIKILSDPDIADFFKDIPCSYEALDTNEFDEKKCRQMRVGTSFFLAGIFALWSGSKMIVPRLRDTESQFLLNQNASNLMREGLGVGTSARDLVKEVPVRWKRCHLIWVSLVMTLPLTMLLEFSYSGFFGENAVTFIAAFSFCMMNVEGVISRAVREALLAVPLICACDVVFFIATMGADDFQDFCEGTTKFFISNINHYLRFSNEQTMQPISYSHSILRFQVLIKFEFEISNDSMLNKTNESLRLLH